jgi:hypothetical protein
VQGGKKRLGIAGFFEVRTATEGGRVGPTCRSSDRVHVEADSARGRPCEASRMEWNRARWLLALLRFRDNVRFGFLYE